MTKDRIVLLSKMRGKTSFSSLFSVKHAFDTKKVGHTGTLDSFAEGLLVVCTGNLTRLAGKITEFDKVYKAVLVFGRTTDTLECTGKTVEEGPLPTVEAFRAAVEKYTSTYMQVPPVFSAIHVDGKRASDVSRKGGSVEIPPRKVTVFSSKILDILVEEDEFSALKNVSSEDEVFPVLENQTSAEVGKLSSLSKKPRSLENISSSSKVKAALIEFHVSKGTYIRSLARDIGKECGSCAYLSALLRTKVGNFSLESAAGVNLLPAFTIQRALKLEEDEKSVSEREVNISASSEENGKLGELAEVEGLKESEYPEESIDQRVQEKGSASKNNKNSALKAKKAPYVPTEEELSFQKEIRDKSREMDKALSVECGFSNLILKDEYMEWFSHGGKLSSKMFDVSPFTLETECAAVFSTTETFLGLLKKDENGYFKYSYVVNQNS